MDANRQHVYTNSDNAINFQNSIFFSVLISYFANGAADDMMIRRENL